MRVKSKLGEYNVSYWNDISTMVRDIGLNSDIVWFVDDNVYSRYNMFSHRPKSEPVTTLVCNEELKSFEYISLIIDHLARMKVKSTSTVIVVGGGTLQDAVSFACSIYNRGVKWVFIPTTLLSMADSCIGGKTSINYRNKKNIIGTYYPPKEVLICTKFLDTLPTEYYESGMGEIIKFHILSGTKFNKNQNINDLIQWSLSYKTNIIERDEFDQHERKYLNYGHTFGHALESTTDFKLAHGIAIMVGIAIVNCYAKNIGLLTEEIEQDIRNILKPYLVGIKYFKDECFDYTNLIEIIKSDKKNTSTINLVILEDNSPTLHSVLNFVPLQESLKEIHKWLRSI